MVGVTSTASPLDLDPLANYRIHGKLLLKRNIFLTERNITVFMTLLVAVSHWQDFDWSVVVHYCHSIQISCALHRQHKLKFLPKIENHVILYAGDTTEVVLYFVVAIHT